MKKILTAAAIGAFALSTAACDSLTGSLGANAATSMSFAAVGDPTLLSNQTRPDSVIRVGGHAIVVTSVDLKISKIELDRAEHQDDDGEFTTKFKDGTVVVGLPVNGKLVTPIKVNLEVGTYDEFEMKVESARIKGTYDGKPFDVTVNVNEELEQDIRPPLVVTENKETNFTVAINIEQWFGTRTGQVIDLITFDATAQAQLKNNIKASFKAFEDEDHDGDDD